MQEPGADKSDSTPKGGPAPSLDRCPVIIGNEQAQLHDLGDGVACFRMQSKMNTFMPEVLDLLEETLARAGHDFSALVLGNDDPRAFSAGADLAFFRDTLEGPDGPGAILRFVGRGQGLFVAMRQAPVPVVAAVHGLTLGGGCEFQMHADATVAHAEALIGVPETGVGLLPGWGGCTRLLVRAHESGPDVSAHAMAERAFATVMPGRISASTAEAVAKGLLRPTDGIVMQRDMLIATAKDRALALAQGYTPPAPCMLPVAGAAGKAQLLEQSAADFAAGRISAVDLDLATTIATVLTGGTAEAGDRLSEADFMRLEREAVAELIARPTTRARINHMLTTGKRLAN